MPFGLSGHSASGAYVCMYSGLGRPPARASLRTCIRQNGRGTAVAVTRPVFFPRIHERKTTTTTHARPCPPARLHHLATRGSACLQTDMHHLVRTFSNAPQDTADVRFFEPSARSRSATARRPRPHTLYSGSLPAPPTPLRPVRTLAALRAAHADFDFASASGASPAHEARRLRGGSDSAGLLRTSDVRRPPSDYPTTSAFTHHSTRRGAGGGRAPSIAAIEGPLSTYLCSSNYLGTALARTRAPTDRTPPPRESKPTASGPRGLALAPAQPGCARQVRRPFAVLTW